MRKLTRLLRASLPALREGAAELVLRREERGPPLDRCLSLQRLLELEGYPSGCLKVFFTSAPSCTDEDCQCLSFQEGWHENDNELPKR